MAVRSAAQLLAAQEMEEKKNAGTKVRGNHRSRSVRHSESACSLLWVFVLRCRQSSAGSKKKKKNKKKKKK